MTRHAAIVADATPAIDVMWMPVGAVDVAPDEMLRAIAEALAAARPA